MASSGLPAFVRLMAAMACIVSEKEASVRTTVKVRMRVNELHDRIGRSSSTRRRLGLEALKHAPSSFGVGARAVPPTSV